MIFFVKNCKIKFIKEEKIIELQNKKKILSENLIEGNGEEMLSNLSEKNIRKLLEAGDE